MYSLCTRPTQNLRPSIQGRHGLPNPNREVQMIRTRSASTEWPRLPISSVSAIPRQVIKEGQLALQSQRMPRPFAALHRWASEGDRVGSAAAVDAILSIALHGWRVWKESIALGGVAARSPKSICTFPHKGRPQITAYTILRELPHTMARSPRSLQRPFLLSASQLSSHKDFVRLNE